MKKKFFNYLFICSSFLILSSCEKDNKITQNSLPLKGTIDLSDNIPTKNEILAISSDVNEIKNQLREKSLNDSVAEIKIEESLQGLVENGENIKNDLINTLKSTNQYETLSDEDKFLINNLSDQQLAQFALFFYQEKISKTEKANFLPSKQQVSETAVMRTCISTALGITGLTNLYFNAAKLATVDTAIAALKIIGQRYASWVGVGLMVYEFADCYYSLTS
jgi:hypothetical protein